ncbi:MAG: hypothetical protein COA83_09885 [Methylophaga sp.]|nr:MAG: hypothetical protein COA83_09885 [Methylophaga sp.]
MENDTPWYETFFDGIGGKVGQWLDYKIGDELGIIQPDSWLGFYPEITPPSDQPPTEAGFIIGNNATTYAAGFGLLLLALIAYKAAE